MRVITSLLLAAVLGATTLQKLSLDDMIQLSTSVLRVHVTGVRTAKVGQDIYTYYSFQVNETLKAGPSAIAEVAVPGGVFGPISQIGVGSPELAVGGDYVIFLWTSKSGLTQVIGLSQGLLAVSSSTADPTLTRAAATSLVIDKNGNPVTDIGLTMRLSDLRTAVQKLVTK
jgi:hypothetical protein